MSNDEETSHLILVRYLLLIFAFHPERPSERRETGKSF